MPLSRTARVSQFAPTSILALGINQLVDKGYTENIETILEKMDKEELLKYIISKYKNKVIQEFDFTPMMEKHMPEVNKLISQYGSDISSSSDNYYLIRENGFVLLSSVLLHILYDEI